MQHLTADEFWTRFTRDPRFALESSTHIQYKTGHVGPWRFNPIQEDYYYRTHAELAPGLWRQVALLNAILKTRQYGQTTLELLLLWHLWATRWGFTAKIITMRDKTSAKLKRIVDLAHESSWKLFAARGMDPGEYLPTAKLDNQHELYCEETGSCLEFTTQKAKGSGRSATLRRVYWTEFSEAEHVGDVMAGYGGSLTEDAIITVDFTGKGTGNKAYQIWNPAWEAQDSKNPDLAEVVPISSHADYQPHFNAFFYGRNDYPYSPAYLARQKMLLGRHYDQEFPATPEDAFRQGDSTLLDGEQIRQRSGERYLCDIMEPAQLRERIYVHGVDTAEGVETGHNCCTKSFDFETGREACPPFRKKVGPEAQADEMAARLALYPGVVVPERANHGHAFIACMRRRGLGHVLYKHPEVDSTGKVRPRKYWKDGWPQGPSTKPLMEENFRIWLREGPLVLVSTNGRRELREYCQRNNGSTGCPIGTNDDGEPYADDEAVAAMLAGVGRKQAARLYVAAQAAAPVSVAGASAMPEPENWE